MNPPITIYTPGIHNGGNVEERWTVTAFRAPTAMWCHACFGRIRQGHYATPLLGILQGPASEFPVYKLVHPICSQIVQEYALTHEIDTTDGISDYTLLAAFRWAAEAHELPLETSPDDVRKHIWLHEFRPKIMTVGEDPA